MSALAEITEVLAGFAVHVGFPDKRAALAGKLLGEGVTADQVEALGVHCEKTVEGEAAAARVLTALLGDPTKRTARLADLGIVDAAKARRAAEVDRPFGDRPYSPSPLPGEDPAAYERERACRMAYCAVVADRRAPEAVARDFGVTVDELQAMVDRGRALADSPLTATKAPAMSLHAAAEQQKESDARRLEFRRQMRADAAKATPKSKPFDFGRMEKEQAKILAQARTERGVDVASLLGDRVKLGALATLEADGVILRAGPPDAQQFQPYRVAKNDQQRAEFRRTFAAWDEQQSRRIRPREEIA
jgi:hypothetical protein